MYDWCLAGIDSSIPALALAEQNAQLNGYTSAQCTFLKDDIAKYMQQQVAADTVWDVVVLDPPKLAPNRKSLDRALAKYRRLNTMVSQTDNAERHSGLEVLLFELV